MTRALVAILLLAPAALAQEIPEGGAMIHLAQTSYIPERTENVTEGALVVLMNFDQVPHSLTALDGTFDVETPAAPPNDFTTVNMTAPGPGEHAFRCRYHPEMAGLLVVKAAPGAPQTGTKDSPGAGSALALLTLAGAATLLRARRR